MHFLDNHACKHARHTDIQLMNAAVAGFLRLINGSANHIPNFIGIVPAILQISAVRHSAGANDITAFAIALRDHRDDFAGSKVNRRYRNLHELSYPLFPGLAVLPDG